MKIIGFTATFVCLIRLSHQLSIPLRSFAWEVGQTVQTSSGPVTGHVAANTSGVSEYLGIPFALPPVGHLRFAPPEPYTSKTVINGSDFGYSCVTTGSVIPNASNTARTSITTYGTDFLRQLAETNLSFSEDCLTLNVWTKPQTGESKKAVMVWIYGGSFTGGSTATYLYNGKHLADTDDVIIVSMNYRLNLFGFPGNPAGRRNLGLLDQRLALEWIRDNIAGFGGEPSRITLFGQSAGGGSVDIYSFAYASDPIVNAFIPESGVVLGTPSGTQDSAVAAHNWYATTENAGCGSSTTGDAAVLACMRSKSYSDLLAAIPSGSSFSPSTDDIIVFSPTEYLSRAGAGNFIQRPMLVGNANYEAGLFKLIDEVAGSTESDTYYNLLDLGFSCPAAARSLVNAHFGIPTWRYWYFGDFPNTRLSTNPSSGAYHGSEIAQIWGNTSPPDTSEAIPLATSEEVAIATYMRQAWTTFAKDPMNGLTSYGWPQYNPLSETLVRLAYNNLTGPNLASPAPYDLLCPVIDLLFIV